MANETCILDFAFSSSEAVMKSMCRPLRAINTHADRIYWVLHLRDMKADWWPALKAEDPAILFRFTGETLAPFRMIIA